MGFVPVTFLVVLPFTQVIVLFLVAAVAEMAGVVAGVVVAGVVVAG